jgi:HPt (histidine-containing phosphotransfer) domain-containing protein
MWARHRTQILDRVTVLEAAASAVTANHLNAADRDAAHAAAHKLAGTLGMFNLTRGTELARELEQMYSLDSAPPTTSGQRLASMAAELRTMIENRKSSS